LWWGRFDPDYSRNRILRQVLEESGWRIEDFQPRFSKLADLEAAVKNVRRPDLVWVPCFRQRDVSAASRFSRRHRVPLLVDPLISAYDKQVFEREKYAPDSTTARRLLAWEQRQLAKADCLLADTRGHADFFRDVLAVAEAKIVVVPVGAEEGLFRPAPLPEHAAGAPREVLFYGSFISLQGAQYIVEAAKVYQGPPVVWRLVGSGPMLAECKDLASSLSHVEFEDWIDYARLPDRIARADILLGVFGTSSKAARVIPNKVYQAAACGRPIVTLRANAYPEELLATADSGFGWVPAGDPNAIANSVAELVTDRDRLTRHAAAVRRSYEEFLSVAHIRRQLVDALSLLGL
jgi:glycosyltransferase involved in cell wall biosynthesis